MSLLLIYEEYVEIFGPTRYITYTLEAQEKNIYKITKFQKRIPVPPI